jgi:hypothetical protein
MTILATNQVRVCPDDDTWNRTTTPLAPYLHTPGYFINGCLKPKHRAYLLQYSRNVSRRPVSLGIAEP